VPLLMELPIIKLGGGFFRTEKEFVLVLVVVIGNICLSLIGLKIGTRP
jgi:hypothetical protein